MFTVSHLDLLDKRPLVLCLGNFDGVHVGHQEVMATLINESILSGAEAVCMTFKPHPKLVLQPDHDPFLLTSFDQRLKFIEDVGVPIVCAIPFDKELAAKTAQEFIDDVILVHPQIKAVIVGFNFHFGFKRQGTPKFLQDYLKDKGIDVIIVEPYSHNGDIVSSSAIREHIQQARLSEAEDLLGRPVNIWGRVVLGSGRGKTLGFPTANLQTEQEILPPYGVYVVQAHIEDQSIQGVMNVGHRPTFEGEHDLAFEVHLFDFEGDLYGKEMNVDVLHKLRDECKFEAKEQLIEQIKKDCLKARAYFDA